MELALVIESKCMGGRGRVEVWSRTQTVSSHPCLYGCSRPCHFHHPKMGSDMFVYRSEILLAMVFSSCRKLALAGYGKL